ncbi:hypothetical protein [Spiroplasma litorale]|nr:hypothetical protein [Spiroplasma litorale]
MNPYHHHQQPDNLSENNNPYLNNSKNQNGFNNRQNQNQYGYEMDNTLNSGGSNFNHLNQNQESSFLKNKKKKRDELFNDDTLKTEMQNFDMPNNEPIIFNDDTLSIDDSVFSEDKMGAIYKDPNDDPNIIYNSTDDDSLGELSAYKDLNKKELKKKEQKEEISSLLQEGIDNKIEDRIKEILQKEKKSVVEEQKVVEDQKVEPTIIEEPKVLNNELEPNNAPFNLKNNVDDNVKELKEITSNIETSNVDNNRSSFLNVNKSIDETISNNSSEIHNNNSYNQVDVLNNKNELGAIHNDYEESLKGDIKPIDNSKIEVLNKKDVTRTITSLYEDNLVTSNNFVSKRDDLIDLGPIQEEDEIFSTPRRDAELEDYENFATSRKEKKILRKIEKKQIKDNKKKKE